jgi:hypothetical protein
MIAPWLRSVMARFLQSVIGASIGPVIADWNRG